MGGPAKMPGDIATMNMPVRDPICEGSLVICATQEDAMEEYDAEAYPNLWLRN